MDQARTEALGYIKKEQMWVHEITHRDGTRGIASICAVTRTTAKVAGITKVYTNPEYRKMGCALRLVRGVCDQ
jgi:predicted GNAT family acetyltransferase